MATEKPFDRIADGLRLRIHLTPNAAQTQIGRIDQTATSSARLRVTVTVPPEKGKANKALISLLSKKLGLPKSSIQIIAGQQSRNKTVMLCCAPDVLQEALDDIVTPSRI